MSPSIPNRAPPSAPQLSDPAMNAERSSQLKDAASLYGRRATILTGMRGVASQPTTQRKVLLGGGA